MIAALTAADLPAINATFNGMTTILLVCGLVLIKRRRYRAHAVVMIAALTTSSLFLVGYITRKIVGREMTLREVGLSGGWLKWTYYSILFPHLTMAIVMIPMIVVTVVRASRRRWDKHRALARPTFWIWLFVSITGMIVYILLYHVIPAYVRNS